ncbi:MAG: argininosuccinate lyase [Candidatus Woesearchaeota archaeon]|jgi:argininosuccinate lyase|nr:argininosuccinate lyase [Candidatus Woesearchaeota archaeon]MDP6265391.1 argininosuccinate lyase [Candidatus Woesearchaeota archaeon]MDP7476219.1 argininosuccinate lyase [Candidatus Woesearchaeota archaeon]HJO01442.1 argininosuccinate lyase [Candidatus Woesearchaeota archaeon]|tara:strand:- start:2663 stop:3844 length:1182 start_codon:yes stop_codon:yes gene_type:complete
MTKLWQKDYKLNEEIENFTVGNDFLLDKELVKYDVLGSIAHATMLNKINIIDNNELQKLKKTLIEILELDKKNKFEIKQEDEDVHTAIENYLTKKLGNLGKKIHTARSRNDQVLTALRLYEKEELKEIKTLLGQYKDSLLTITKKYGKIKIPGYTHMQKAMPTDVKTWLGSFISSIEDNLKLLDAAYSIIDKSPLGSAAGFGIPSIKINKKMTASLMGFSEAMSNPMYAQLSRGKLEATILHLLSQIMLDLNKLSTDLMLFNMQEFGFISLPKDFCTGSSIMPQKKNPDVLELVRAKYHVVLGEEFKVKSMISNLISGYNRDLQLTKEPVISSLEIVKSCIKMMVLTVSKIKIDEKKCEEALTKELYATEEAYKLVKKGIPFREAYKKVSRKF